MSSKRKFSRAQGTRAKSSAPDPAKSRTELRKETAEERFKKPGSAELWIALLGWSAERVERIWLVQHIHDAARARERGVAVERVPALSEHELEKCVDLWLASGDELSPEDPAPKWHYLAALFERLKLGETSGEELQNDWEAWTSLRLAAPLRNALMTTLGQAEQAAVALSGMTGSDNAAAIVNVLRSAWTALAYGDARSFEKLRGWSDEWLALAAATKPS